MKSGHLATLQSNASLLSARFAKAAHAAGVEDPGPVDVVLSPARSREHGDYATPAALAAAKRWGRNPMVLAESVVAEGVSDLRGVAEIRAAKPGFVNLTMVPAFWHEVVAEALQRGDDYGTSDALANFGPVLIEFTSANPTGPLLVVQGRSGSLGATLVDMFRFAGAQTHSETYVNDTGGQLDTLADSIYARYATLCGVETRVPDDGYPGDYVVDLAKRLRDRDGDRWLNAELAQRRAYIGRFGRDLIVDQQRADMERFGVHFDRWISEAELHASGAVEAALADLVASDYAYERDGALWLRTQAFGDQEDRVLRRSDGRPTYLAADAAYHRDKLKRGNRYLIDILGPDHHGYIARLKALVAAFGHPGSLEVLIAQQVTLRRGTEAVAMSKRAGNVVTLSEVMDEVGVDAARFFFIDRAPESHLVFDLALAVETSQKNPVFYVQYGHARIASILNRAATSGRAPALERARRGSDLARLEHPAEFALIRRLSDFERTVVDGAKDRAPHRLAEYAHELAADFHGFYTECTVLTEDDAVASARLSLCLAAKGVLASALRLLGVSAPETM
jgi:arginyl-tRNA synthetase